MPSPTVINSAGMPCIPEAGVPVGAVPHPLPGQNPLLEEMMKLYHIPPEAALGGAGTMYPAFRDKIKATSPSRPRARATAPHGTRRLHRGHLPGAL